MLETATWGRVLIPPVPSAINTAGDASPLPPISAVIRTSVAIAWIGVTVAWIRISVSGIAAIISGIGRIRVASIVSTVAWITGTHIDADALCGGFERHHSQGKGDGAHT
jgi:hypothetical protein